MNTLDALLPGIVADPLEETRWLVLADWLEENDDPRRAELLRLHRKLLATSVAAGRPPCGLVFAHSPGPSTQIVTKHCPLSCAIRGAVVRDGSE